MNPHYPLIADRAEHRCEFCQAPEAIFNFAFEVEHIIPPSYGGSDEDTNLALSCRSCNLYKSNHIEFCDPEADEVSTLFNPRQESWHSHFEIDTETCTIVGLTPVGRATSACLRMNSESQITARRQWMRLGLFP